MTQDAIGHLCAMLFGAITEISGYQRPHDPPRVTLISQSDVARIACNGPCAARAVYVPGDGVYMDADLDVENDAFARSVLVHELVHYLQGTVGRFAKLDPCSAWNAREREAYLIQNAYLEYSKTAMHVANSRIAECSAHSS